MAHFNRWNHELKNLSTELKAPVAASRNGEPLTEEELKKYAPPPPSMQKLPAAGTIVQYHQNLPSVVLVFTDLAAFFDGFQHADEAVRKSTDLSVCIEPHGEEVCRAHAVVVALRSGKLRKEMKKQRAANQVRKEGTRVSHWS